MFGAESDERRPRGRSVVVSVGQFFELLLAGVGALGESLGELVDRECDRLDVGGIRAVYDAESGATRQRRLRCEEGVAALADDLLLATKS